MITGQCGINLINVDKFKIFRFFWLMPSLGVRSPWFIPRVHFPIILYASGMLMKKIGRVANFKNRKLIANGIFLSKLSYLIPLWGGCNLNLLHSLQILQNKAARIVTKLDWGTPTSVLLSQCGWLSVYQLSVYQTCILVHKVLASKSPLYLFNLITMD